MEKTKIKKTTKKVKKTKEIKKVKKTTSKTVVQKPKPKLKPKPKPKPKKAPFIEAIGRRKTSVARVRLWTKGEKEFLVNNKLLKDYFPNFEIQKIAADSLDKMKSQDRFKIQALVKGGGFHSQAEAVRHGVARVLLKFNPDFKKRLKKSGYLTRDPRMRERKKFGLKRARRAPQWRKR